MIDLPRLVIGMEMEYVAFVPASRPTNEGWMDMNVSIAAGPWKGRIQVNMETRDWLQFRKDLPALYSPSTEIRLEPLESEIELRMQSDKLGHIDVTGGARTHFAPENNLEFHLPQLDQTFIRTWIKQTDAIIQWLEKT